MTVTLITGATRGIGYETARLLVDLGHVVYIGARDLERGNRAAAAVGARCVQLDVTDDESVRQALQQIDSAEGRLDVLVHNAGILETEMSSEAALRSFNTNAVGILRVTEAALPLLRKSDNANVVTISSSAGSFWAVTNPERGEYHLSVPLYSASKTAATMLTIQYSKTYPDITFTALEPGPTATDMTAAFGIGRPVHETAQLVARFARIDPTRPTGTFQDEDGELRW